MRRLQFFFLYFIFFIKILNKLAGTSYYKLRDQEKTLKLKKIFNFRTFIFRLKQAHQQAHQQVYQRSNINNNPKRLRKGMPIVSVIIPCFNYGTYIEMAIQSVLRQTLTNLEIIVVEGGSDDGVTKKQVKKLQKRIKDKRIKFFYRAERHLVGDNRNYGIREARGKYICCLDADDTVMPTYLEKAIFYLEVYGYDISSAPTHTMENPRKKFINLPNPTLQDMSYGNFITTSAVFRKIIWDKVKGYRDFGMGKDHLPEDYDFWIRALSTSITVRNFQEDYLFNYRLHKGYKSLSNLRNIKSQAQQRKILLNINKDLLTKKNFSASKKIYKNLRYSVPSKTSLALDGFLKKNKNKKTILIIMPFFLVGGAERLLSSFCLHLKNKGWHISLVSTLPQNKIFGNSCSWFEESTFELYQLPIFLKSNEYNDFIDYLIASRSFNIILNTGSQFFYDALPSLRKKHKKIKIVDYLFNTIGHTSSHLESKKNFNGIFCENKEVERWAEEVARWHKSSIFRISSGINLDVYRPKKKDSKLQKIYNIKHTDLVIGYFGRLSEEKGPDIFLKIAQQCQTDSFKNVKFIMIGSGPMQDDILSLSKSFKKKNFIYLGMVDDTSQYISACDIVLLPSRQDGRPLIVLEALALGVPVIANNIGGLYELIKHKNNGYLVDKNDITTFSDYILELFLDRNKLNKMKRNARQFAIQYLDANIANKVFESSLKKLIS
jgi:glycosyltransferase involved in cell wall biosynthesis